MKKILKRIASVMLAVSIVLSFALVNVCATDIVPDGVKTDYVAGDDGNLITTWPTNGNLDINAGGVSASASGSVATVSATADFSDSNATWGIKGFQINAKFNEDWATAEKKPNFAIGTKVLFAAKVRNASDTTANAKINVVYPRVGNLTIIWNENYPTENDGLTVTGTDWVDFKTVATVDREFGTSRVAVFGYALGATTGTKVQLDMSSMYYGEEIAHDIEVTTENNVVYAGTSTVAEAKIVNQLDDKFSGTQGGFTWYALTDDRESFAEGIAVTDNGDGTAKVTVAPTVAAGTYDIVAMSDTYEGFVKGTTIEVKSIDFSDSVPSNDGNFITKTIPEGTNVSGNGAVSCGKTGNVVTMSTASDVGATGWGLNGFIVDGKFYDAVPFAEGGDKLLFGAKVKNAADATVTPGKISVVSQRAQKAYIWPAGASGDTEGFEINGTDWVDYKVVMDVPTDSVWDQYRYLVVGLPNGTAAGTKVSLDLSTMFYGIEKAYGLDVTADSDKVMAGSEVAVTAEVSNQIGTAYSKGNDDISWFVMNADRTAFAEGFTVTKGENGTATVAVADTVAAGRYSVVAIHNEDDELIKGITIKVQSFEDYVPGDDGNFITKTIPEGTNVSGNGAVSCGTTGNVVTMSATSDVGATGWGLTGFIVNEKFYDEVPFAEAGDKLLFGAKVKNAADATVTPGKISVVSQRAQKAYIWPAGASGDTEGFEINGTDWVDYKVVMDVPTDSVWDQYRYLVVGLPNGTAAGTKVSLDLSTMFYGIEKAYDIKVTSASTPVDAGSALTVEADIVNQLDMTYSGEMGDFEWIVMNSDKSSVAPGFTIQKGADGVAEVSVADDVPAGNYNVIAMSDTYDGFVKSLPITVTEKTDEIVGITLIPENGAVTVATDTQLTNAHLIFATYDANGRMIDCEVKYVNLSAQGSEEFAPSELTAGSYTKVMLWKDITYCIPLANTIRY